MALQNATRAGIAAFLLAAVVPAGLLFGTAAVAPSLAEALPLGELGFLLAWAIVVGGGSGAVSRYAGTGLDPLLPALVGGVAVSFGAVQVAWGQPSVLAVFAGLVAIVLVAAGCLLGTKRPHGVPDRATRRRLGRAATVAFLLALAADLAASTGYWFQGSPGVAAAATTALLVASPALGFGAVWWVGIRPYLLLPFLAAAPFLVVVTGVVTGPLSALFGLTWAGPLSIAESAVELAGTAAVLVAVGAVVGWGIGRFGGRETRGVDAA